MARRKKRSGGDGGGAGWIVTFSDLMTLLLTFFVLLLSMSSMDGAKLAQIAFFDTGTPTAPLVQERFLFFGKSIRLPERGRIIEEIIRHPPYPTFVEEHQDLVKELLFPEELLPPELPKLVLDENLLVLEQPEGIVVILTAEMLFGQDSHELSDQGKALLHTLTPVIQSINSGINISGYTDNTPGRVMSNDHLSALWAMAAVEYFLQEGLQPERFSMSGYGADWPMFDNDTAEGRAKNRRMEILLKTADPLSGY